MFSGYSFIPLQPCQALPHSIADYVHSVASSIGIDANTVAITSMAAANALLLGATCEVNSSFHIGSSLFFAVGAPPSAGKSPCVELVMKPFHDVIETHLLLSQEDEQQLLSKKAVLNARAKQVLREAAKEDDEYQQQNLAGEYSKIQNKLSSILIPQSPVMGEMSPYSFIKELEARGGVGVNIDAEGGVFASAASVAPTQLRPWLRAWSSEPLVDKTKKKCHSVEEPTFVVAALWQTEPLLQFLRSDKYYDIGLVARVLPYIVTQSARTGVGELQVECEQRYHDTLENVLIASIHAKKMAGRRSFCLSSEARELLMHFKEYASGLTLPGEMLFEYPEVAGKLDSQAVKLAMVIHALENSLGDSKVIHLGTMRTACNLTLFFCEQMAMILDSSLEDALIKEGVRLIELLKQWGRSSPHQGFTVEQLCRPTGFTKRKCDKFLFWLAQQKAVLRREEFVPYPDGRNVITEFWYPNLQKLTCLNC